VVGCGAGADTVIDTFTNTEGPHSTVAHATDIWKEPILAHTHTNTLPQGVPDSDPSPIWSCALCGTTDTSLRYKSGKMPNCYTCQAYTNACINSRQKKTKRAHKGHTVSFTLAEFHDWARTHPRQCRYCHMVDAEYYAMGFTSANGKTLEALGLDRLVDDDYRLDNITWCCYPCNRTKNSIYTPEEMERLGTLISQIWAERRAEEASDTQVTLFPVTPRKAKPKVIALMPADRQTRRYTAAHAKPKPKPMPTRKRKRSR
jgi:hypothetical protein